MVSALTRPMHGISPGQAPTGVGLPFLGNQAGVLGGGGAAPAAAPSTGLYLPNTSGEYVSTPSISMASDLSVVAYVALDYWVPTTGTDDHTFAAKFNASAFSWIFGMDGTGASGYFRFVQSTDGVSVTKSFYSSVAPTVSNGEWLWVGVSYHNYVAGSPDKHQVKFWTGGAGDTPSWSQLGSTQEETYGSSIFNPTTPISIGGHTSGASDNLRGKVQKVQIYDGIGANTAPGQGTLVYEADFSHPWVNGLYTDQTGKVSTINGSAWAWEHAS